MERLRQSDAETCIAHQNRMVLSFAATRLLVQKISANGPKWHHHGAMNSSTLGQVHTRWRSP